MSDRLGPQARSLTVIYNPAAGQRRGAFFTRVLAALEERGWRAELRTTAGPGDARDMAAAAAREGTARLAVAGGDGTIHEAVNGLASVALPSSGLSSGLSSGQSSGQSGPLLGIIPLGTANVLAQEIGLPVKPDPVATTLTGRREIDTRLGRIGEKHFLLMAGAGFDAEVVAGVSQPLKRKLGKGAYVWETLRQGFRYDFPELTLSVDGDPATARSLIVARARHYGGSFVLSRDAGLETEGLQAFLFEEGGPLAVLRYSLGLMLGRLERTRGVERRAVTRIVIEAPAGRPLQADGDCVGTTPVEIALSDRRLRLLVP